MEKNEITLAASRMARQLVQVVEPILYGWEVKDARDEFEAIVLAGLREFNERTSASDGGGGEPRP